MPSLKPPGEDLSLAPAELAFASHAFRLAWTRIASKFMERPDVTQAARDLLARAVLSHIGQRLGEPEVVALRALRTFGDILPVAAPDRDLRHGVPGRDPNVRACWETAVFLEESRAIIDGIIARQRETRTMIEGALAIIAEQRRQV
jgi:hypothetical protein